jgi:hypothetical protein
MPVYLVACDEHLVLCARKAGGQVVPHKGLEGGAGLCGTALLPSFPVAVLAA